jgi:hypothetical protein
MAAGPLTPPKLGGGVAARDGPWPPLGRPLATPWHLPLPAAGLPLENCQKGQKMAASQELPRPTARSSGADRARRQGAPASARVPVRCCPARGHCAETLETPRPDSSQGDPRRPKEAQRAPKNDQGAPKKTQEKTQASGAAPPLRRNRQAKATDRVEGEVKMANLLSLVRSGTGTRRALSCRAMPIFALILDPLIHLGKLSSS